MTIEVREFTGLEVRESEGKWLVEGVAVPYGQPTFISGQYREQFERGAFADYSGGATLYAAHGHLRGELPIGRIDHAEEREEGLFIRAKISQTTAGRDAYTLLKDGAVDRFSIGFEPVAQETRTDDEGEVLVRTKATLREVSVVGMPAYTGAGVTAVRSHTPTEVRSEDNQEGQSLMEDFAPKADLIEVREGIETLTRQIDVLKANSGSGDPAPEIKYRSLGEFVKALGERKSEAREQAGLLVRAYTGAVVADHAGQRPGWIERDLKQVAQARDILEFFSKDNLPAEGMTVTYPVFGTQTGDVSEQTAEGNDLTYIEVSTSTGTSPVKTYGGYSSLSRQLIERSSASYLNAVLNAQRLSYAKVTNGAVRTLLSTTPAAYNQGTVAFADKGKAQAWVLAVANGCADIAQNSVGLAGGAWIMGRANAIQLASIVDSAGRPVFAINGDGANTIGDVDLRSLKLNVGGLPVLVDFNLSGTDSFIVAREAITVLEDGAKYLQDENVINLTKDFSIYGYMALTKNDVKGITRVTHPAS